MCNYKQRGKMPRLQGGASPRGSRDRGCPAPINRPGSVKTENYGRIREISETLIAARFEDTPINRDASTYRVVIERATTNGGVSVKTEN